MLRALLYWSWLCLLCWTPRQDAEALWATGDRRDALSAIESALLRNPSDTATRLRLGAWLLELQRPAAALDAVAPIDARADRLRAMALYVLARYEEALPLLDPTDPDQTLMIVDSLLALARTDEVDAALARAASALGDQHPRVLALRGRMLAARGRHAQAVPLFREALAGDPLDRQASFGLGQSLVRSGEREQGLAVLARHRELAPLLDERDFALQALALDPSVAGHHTQLGDIERELGLVERAITRYEAAMKWAQRDEIAPIALRHARLLVEDRGALDEALARLTAAAARVQDTRLPVRAGDLLMDAGRPADALRHFLRAQQWRPDDTQIQVRVEMARIVEAARAAEEEAR